MPRPRRRRSRCSSRPSWGMSREAVAPAPPRHARAEHCAMETGTAFLAQSREYLTAHYLPKIRAAVERLGEEDLWWRPNEASNSIGNLMLLDASLGRHQRSSSPRRSTAARILGR